MSNRVFGPKSKDHPSIGEKCPGCGKPFKEGDYTTLVEIGPGDDEYEQKRKAEGRAYNAVAVEAHAKCAGMEEPDNEQNS